METIGLDRLLEKSDDETVEVLVGLNEDEGTERLELYCGDDGEVINETGFNICRTRMTVSCLRDLTIGGDGWVDYIEPAAQEAEVTWDTEYDADYDSESKN